MSFRTVVTVVDFPRDEGSITDEFVSAAIGMPVSVVKVTVLEGGQLSDTYRVQLRQLDDTVGAPTSIVVKVPSWSEDRRSLAIVTDAYVKEVNFYRLLADEVPIGSPKIYDCRMHNDDFVIVMEDLCAHSIVFDQVNDPPDEQFARKIAMEAARLHAAYWESATTELSWVGQPDGRYVFGLDALCRSAPSNLKRFLELWQEMYGVDLLDGEPEIAELTSLLCGPLCIDILERIYDTLSTRPKTLLHGDMRADNVFRRLPDSDDDDGPELTFVDWQIVHAGPPGPEFAQAWMHSLEPDVRRKDLEILASYHERLLDLHPAAATYTYPMLIEDYTMAYCFWWTCLITLGAGNLPNFDQPAGQRNKQLWGKCMTRAFAGMKDLHCLSLIQDIASDLAIASEGEELRQPADCPPVNAA